MRFILILSVLGTLAAGCDPADRAGGGEGVAVATSFYPLFETAARVGGDRAEVTNLTPPGAEPHDIELTPEQVDLLLDADVVVYAGGGFQPAVEAIAARRDGITVDVLARVLPPPRSDPHFWLDPVRMAEAVDVVATALSEADPDGDGQFRRRARELRAEIEDLHRRFQEGLEDCDRRLIVTTHAAFGHLAARYGLDQEAVSGLEPEGEPDPARLAELEDLVRREGVTTVFTEPLVSPRVAETMARETGARVDVLDPLEGLSEAQMEAGHTYVTVMEANLGALRTALGCR